jgi:outer membrane receptor protein involved in Fe transport
MIYLTLNLFKRLAWLLTVSFFPFLSFGQSILHGTIRDAESKQPLPGAVILDVNDKANGTVTSSNGQYRLELTPGEYTFSVSFLGMKSDTIRIRLAESALAKADISLHPLVTEMDMVVVSASKYEQRLEEVTVSMQIIRPQLIESKNTVNIKSVLEQSPGLTILDEEPQMRGGSGFSFGVGSRVATLIDGLPILTGDAGRTDWNFIPTENIEQIEIIEGASSVLYGSSALSGTINFRTRYPKGKNSTYVRTYSGFYSAPQNDSAKWWNGNANFSGINFSHAQKFGQLDLIVGGQAAYDHNFIGPYILDGSLPIKADTLDNSDVANRSGRINFNLRYRPAKTDRLTFGLNGNAMKAHTNFSLVWGNAGDQIYRAFPGTMTISDFTAYYFDPYLNYYSRFGTRHTFRSRWYHTDNENSNNQSNSADVVMAEYLVNHTFKSLENLNVTAGVFYNDTWSHANLYSGSGSPDNRLRNRSAYMQLDKKIFNRLNLQAGMRGEYFRINEEEESVKSVFRSGANFEVARGTNLRASYGQGYRFPTITERYITTTTGGIYVFPNTRIQPESSWSTELGVKQGFKLGKFMGYADFAWFHQEYRNTIEYVYAIWAMDSAGFKFLNTGNSRVRGYEVSVLGSGQVYREFEVTLLLGYTYVKPQTLNPGFIFATDSAEAGGGIAAELSYLSTSTDTSDHILKYRFRHQVKADVEISWRRFSIGGSARYYSFMENIDKTFYDLDATVLPTGIRAYREKNNKGSMVFDARISCRFGKYYSVAFISNNITNLEYSLRPLKIESPRTVAIQLTAKI